MPRNSVGIYTLPTGNPVAPNTLIQSSWANSTLSDVATALTDSLDRQGRGGMLVPFKNVDGTLALPGITFANEVSSGIARLATGEMSFITTATLRAKMSATGTDFYRPTQAGGVLGLRLNTQDTGKVWSIYNPAASADLRLSSSSVVDMATFTEAGLIGINVAPSAWNATGYKPIDIGTRGLSVVGGTDLGVVGVGVYDDGAGTWKYKGTTTYRPTRIDFFDGSFTFLNAPAGAAAAAAAFTTLMQLNSIGLGIGIAPTEKLTVLGVVQARNNGDNFRAINPALTNGGSFGALAGAAAGVVLSADNGPVFLNTGGVNRLTVSAVGNVGIGVAPDAAYRLDIEAVNTAQTRLRATNSASYAVSYITNDIGTTARSLSMLYSGSTWAGPTLIGGPSGEQGNVATIGAYPLVFGTSNNARISIDAAGITNFITGSGSLRVGGLITRFESAEQNIISGSTSITVAHGGARKPDQFRAVLRCKINEGGWVVGQEIPVVSGAGGSFTCQTIADATNVIFQQVAAGGNTVIYNTSNAPFAVNAANWKLVFYVSWL